MTTCPLNSINLLEELTEFRETITNTHQFIIKFDDLLKDNPMDRGVWWATVHGVTKSQTRLRTHTST